MRLSKLSWCLLLLSACSSRTPLDADDFDGGLDASTDRATGGSGGSRGGSGGSGATGGASTGGFGGTGATGGTTGKGGSGGTGGTGATGGASTGGSGGTGATGGVAGKGGSSGTGGVAGTGGFAGSLGGSGGASGKAGGGGTGGFGGTFGGSAGVGGSTGGFGGTFGGSAGVGGSTGGFAGSFGGSGGFAGTFGGTGGFAGSFPPPPPWDAGPPPDGPLPPWNDPACPAGTGSTLLGNWVGYVENHPFPSGSDALHVNIRGADSASLCGSITFGDTTALPPPNPNVGYPPGLDLANSWPPNMLPIERFTHTLFGGLVSGKRVRFQAEGYEPWRAWCTMQKSYLVNQWSPHYSCLESDSWGQDWNPDGGAPTNCYLYDPNTGQPRGSIDCGKAYQCGSWQVCACNSAGCAAEKTYQIQFDAQFEAAEARGSIILYTQNGTQVFNLYLTKTD